MATMLVGYDLNKPGQNYSDLIEALTATGTYWHHLDSTWLVETEESVTELRDRLTAFLDSNDKIVVIDVTSDPIAWRGIKKSGSDWLSDMFGP